MFYWSKDLTQVTTEHTPAFLNRNDLRSLDDAMVVAKGLTANIAGRTFLHTDAGPNWSPRFDVVEPPKVGDQVSQESNGDAYYVGVVEKVSKTYRIVTVRCPDGSTVQARRRLITGTWRVGGGWALVKGVVEKRNPSF